MPCYTLMLCCAAACMMVIMQDKEAEQATRSL